MLQERNATHGWVKFKAFNLEYKKQRSWVLGSSCFQVPQAVEVLALKQDSVVHRCLEGIKA